MTDAQYQALYKSGSMDTQTRVDYERYLAMQKFINNMNNQTLGDNVEVIKAVEEPPVFINDETIDESKTRINKNNKKSLLDTTKSKLSWCDEITKNLNNKRKNLTLDYGPIPGFKQALDNKGNKQGYYDADENSPFWKTDAGYEKAMQTWGNSGTLPQFVKKPVREELNINAIKDFFKLNK